MNPTTNQEHTNGMLEETQSLHTGVLSLSTYRTSITRAVLVEGPVKGPICKAAVWGSSLGQQLGPRLCRGVDAQGAHTDGHSKEAHVQGLLPGALVLLALLSKEEWKL